MSLDDPRARACALSGVLLCAFVVVSLASLPPADGHTVAADAPATLGLEALKAKDEVYLGNGCFWERQWAYYNLEVAPPFGRMAEAVTARVGYAGGKAPPAEAVCYHTGDARDYARLGHAEVVRVTLAKGAEKEQMGALAKDFFASFTGSSGARQRPDPMDRGAPYRSVVGLPGGVHSDLYAAFAKENVHGMALKPGTGGDADEFNTVWIVDSRAFPFFMGEVYHQMHCNFFASEGMPYPDSYVLGLWKEMQQTGAIKATGCPESAWNHRSCAYG